MKSDFGHPRVIVTETRDWPEQAALHFLTTARDAVAHRGAFHVVVPGGSTPRQAFAHVVAHAGANDPCWERTHLYFGDERLVAPDHPDSNFRMIREALLDQAPIPAEQVHRIPGELEAEEAARRYAGVVGSFLRSDVPQGNVFDLVILGLGPDGHVASLIPGGQLDFVAEGLVGVGSAPMSPAQVRRVTLTPTTLRSCRELVLWVRGGEKAGAVQGALRGGMPTMVPEVVPPDGRVTWILDRAAAAALG